MEYEFNSFSRKYGLDSVKFQAGGREIRLAVANGEPVPEHLQACVTDLNGPLLYPMDRGGWALVTSKDVHTFGAPTVAAAVDHAKGVLVGKE